MKKNKNVCKLLQGIFGGAPAEPSKTEEKKAEAPAASIFGGAPAAEPAKESGSIFGGGGGEAASTGKHIQQFKVHLKTCIYFSF